MRSFLRDWQRWSHGERIAAVTIVAGSLLVGPVALAMGVH